MTPGDESKRRFLLGASSLGALLLTGCDRLSETEWFESAAHARNVEPRRA